VRGASTLAVSQRIKALPTQFQTGAEWVYESEGRRFSYRIVARSADGQLRTERLGDRRETIFGADERGALQLSEIRLPNDDSQDGLTLKFGEDQSFEASIADAKVLTGRVESDVESDRARIRLAPSEPAWASRRSVDLACRRDGDVWTHGDDNRGYRLGRAVSELAAARA
jgi:hypothetical protein